MRRMLTKHFWYFLLATLYLSDAASNRHHSSSELLDHKTLLCEDDDAPMCARAGTEYLLFSNECQLVKAQRTRLIGDIKEVSLRYCIPDCEFPCGAHRKPLCGLSASTGERRTFRNKCELVRMSCRSPADWLICKWNACSLSPDAAAHAKHKMYVKANKSVLPVPCRVVYKPVCAVYAGVKSTFENECQVNAEVLRTQKKWSIISQGVCPEDYQTIKFGKFETTTQRCKPTAVTEQRPKRSYNWDSSQDVPLSADTVTIYMPPAFETEFISSGGKRTQQRQGFKPMGVASGKPCMFSNEPVCGAFNGESRTFAHVCALIEHSRRTQDDWTILHEGVCRTCDFKCDGSYAPICVNRNGINYTMLNRCYLKRVQCRDRSSSWQIVSEGECSSPLQDIIEGKYDDTTTPAYRSTTKYPSMAPPQFLDAKRHVTNKPITEVSAARTTSENSAMQQPTTATRTAMTTTMPTTTTDTPWSTSTMSWASADTSMATTETSQRQLNPRTAATTIAATTITFKRPKIYKGTAKKTTAKTNRKSSKFNANTKSIARQFLWVQPNSNVNKKLSTKSTTTSAATSIAKSTKTAEATITESTTIATAATTTTTIQRPAKIMTATETSRTARTTTNEPATATTPTMAIALTTNASSKKQLVTTTTTTTTTPTIPVPKTTTTTSNTTETAIHFIITPLTRRNNPTMTTTTTTATKATTNFENYESQTKLSKKYWNSRTRQRQVQSRQNITTTPTTTTKTTTTTTTSKTLSRPMQVKSVDDAILRPTQLAETLLQQQEKTQKTSLMGIRIPTDAIPKLLPPSMIAAATPPYSYWIKKVSKAPVSLRSKILKMKQEVNERTSIYGHGMNSVIMRMVRKSMDNNQLE